MWNHSHVCAGWVGGGIRGAVVRGIMGAVVRRGGCGIIEGCEVHVFILLDEKLKLLLIKSDGSM